MRSSAGVIMAAFLLTACGSAGSRLPVRAAPATSEVQEPGEAEDPVESGDKAEIESTPDYLRVSAIVDDLVMPWDADHFSEEYAAALLASNQLRTPKEIAAFASFMHDTRSTSVFAQRLVEEGDEDEVWTIGNRVQHSLMYMIYLPQGGAYLTRVPERMWEKDYLLAWMESYDWDLVEMRKHRRDPARVS